MTPSEGLLDTSTLVLLGRIPDPTVLPDEPALSVAPIPFDALVAATAVATGMPVCTCPDDFRRVTGLEVVTVSHPDR